MEISYQDLTKLMVKVADQASEKTLQKAGLLKIIFTRSEVVRLYGIGIYRNSLPYVNWQKKGAGRTSSLICLRAEFENYIQKFDLELKELSHANKKV